MGRATDDASDRIGDDAAVDHGSDTHDVARLIVAGRDREAAHRGARRTASERGGAMDTLQQLDQLAGPLGGVVAGLTAEDLARPTPCADFDVRGVLEHMVAGATAFAAAC